MKTQDKIRVDDFTDSGYAWQFELNGGTYIISEGSSLFYKGYYRLISKTCDKVIKTDLLCFTRSKVLPLFDIPVETEVEPLWEPDFTRELLKLRGFEFEEYRIDSRIAKIIFFSLLEDDDYDDAFLPLLDDDSDFYNEDGELNSETKIKVNEVKNKIRSWLRSFSNGEWVGTNYEESCHSWCEITDKFLCCVSLFWVK